MFEQLIIKKYKCTKQDDVLDCGARVLSTICSILCCAAGIAIGGLIGGAVGKTCGSMIGGTISRGSIKSSKTIHVDIGFVSSRTIYLK